MDVASCRYVLSAPEPSMGCRRRRGAARPRIWLAAQGIRATAGRDMNPVGHSLGGSHGDWSPRNRRVVAAEAQRIDGCDLGRPQHGRAHGQDALPRVGDRVASRGERYQRDGERPSGGECRQGDGRQKQPPNQVQACDSIGLPRRRHPQRPSRNARSCDPAGSLQPANPRPARFQREQFYGSDGGRVPCVPKSTFGTFFASSGASKYCWGWKPTARA